MDSKKWWFGKHGPAEPARPSTSEEKVARKILLHAIRYCADTPTARTILRRAYTVGLSKSGG